MPIRFVIVGIVLVSIFWGPICSGRTWTVCNRVIERADFSTLQAGMNAASAGDTILVYGSWTTYGPLELSKELTIIGPGYFLEANGTQAMVAAAMVGPLVFAPGSDGSVVIGMTISVNLAVNGNDLVIKRNLISDFIGTSDVSNIFFEENYFSTQHGYAIGCGGTNIYFINNFLQSTAGYLITGNATNIQLINNVLDGALNISNFRCQNNIFLSGSIPGASSVISNNILDDQTTVFVGGASPDGRWKLKVASPALGAGVNGADCGMFGGDSPYVLSGIPPIPTIYSFDAPFEGGNQLPIKIKVKSNK